MYAKANGNSWGNRWVEEKGVGEGEGDPPHTISSEHWRPVTSSVPQGGQYWVKSCSKASLVVWMVEYSIPSATLLMAQNWEEWLMHQRVEGLQQAGEMG